MSSTATAVLPSGLQEIERLFEIDDMPAVRRYLEQFDFLAPLLIEVSRNAPRFFPSPIRFQLHLLADRVDAYHVDLFAVIQTDLPEDEALRRLDQFDAGWWLRVAGQGRGRLTVDVESLA